MNRFAYSYLFQFKTASVASSWLVFQLLRYNPHERLGSGVAGAEEIKAHNFFYGIDWNTLEYIWWGHFS